MDSENPHRAAPRIRDATAADADVIAAIYADYVRTSPATFEEEPPDADEMRRRIEHVHLGGLPWRVATDERDRVCGYAYAAPYRTRSAYRHTLEDSVYIAREHLRRGLGFMLMQDIIESCTRLGYRQMLAVIGDSTNEASVRLHQRLGFALIGIHPAVGFKFGRWIDVVHMQLALGAGSSTRPNR